MNGKKPKHGKGKTDWDQGVAGVVFSDEERDEVIDHLIHRCQRECITRRIRLAGEMKRLAKNLDEKERMAALQEIRCFKHVLALHRARQRRRR